MDQTGPNCSQVIGKATLEIFGFIILLIPLSYIYVFINNYEPYKRYETFCHQLLQQLIYKCPSDHW